MNIVNILYIVKKKCKTSGRLVNSENHTTNSQIPKE